MKAKSTIGMLWNDPYVVFYMQLDSIIDKVKQILGEDSKRIYDVSIDVREVGNVLEAAITMKIDVTDVIGNELKCLNIQLVGEECSEAVAEQQADPDVSEKEYVRCLEERRREFVRDNAIQSFYFAWSDGVAMTAYLKTEADSDSIVVCIRDFLYIIVKTSTTKEAVMDVDVEDRAIDIIANNIVAAIKTLMEALRVLSNIGG